MTPGAFCQQEFPIGSNNLLAEIHNFNTLSTWIKTSGGGNADIANDVLGRRSFAGLGALKIDFTGTGQVSFNNGVANITSGNTPLARVIQKDGNYILSYAFDKSDVNATIVFIIEMYVNGTLAEVRKITHDLYNSSGFVNNQWNIYYQNFVLSYGNVVDFAFKAQSDTTGVQLYFDRFKLEVDDKGAHIPTLYSEAPLAIYEEENEVLGFTLADGASTTITGSITGALVNDANRKYVLMDYPVEYMTKGLQVHTPLLTADGVVKVIIENKSGSSQTVADNVINFRIARQ